MTSMAIIAHLANFTQPWLTRWSRRAVKKRPNLHELAQHSEHLPDFVQESAVARRYLHLLGPLAWDLFPERNLSQKRGFPAVPYAPFVAACLIKLDQQFTYMSQLRQYLLDHPALVGVEELRRGMALAFSHELAEPTVLLGAVRHE